MSDNKKITDKKIEPVENNDKKVGKDSELREVKFKTVSRTKRRMDSNLTAGRKNVLVVDENMLDRTRFVYRVVSDVPGNIEVYKAIDYDPVMRPDVKIGDDDASKSNHDGSTVRVDIGGGKTGILMSKPIEWHEADQKAKEKRLQDMDKEMRAKNHENHEKID